MIIDHRNAGPEILGNQMLGGDMARGFSGVSLSRGTLSSITVFNGLNFTLDWETIHYDFGGWFDIDNPTFVTVPEGVTRVRHQYTALFTGTFGASNVVRVDALREGVYNVGFGRVIYPPITGVFNMWPMVSPAYDVNPGDTLAVSVIAQNISSTLTIFAGTDTSFQVEAVSMEF